MSAFLASVVVLVWAVRLSRVRGLWRLPLRNGEEFFLAQRVGPGFYGEGGAGADLLRRYRVCLFLPLVLDAPLALWLVADGRYPLLVCEQWVALILSVVVYNVLFAHFSARATILVGPEDERPATTLQLSMAPRRLRDHSHRSVELAIAACLLVSLAMLAFAEGLAEPLAGVGRLEARAVRRGELAAVWILYLQAGLLLLKLVFVRWRMPLPVRRTEDFRRWRGAWLGHHLKVFDATRVLCALLLLSMMAWLYLRHAWPGVGAVGGVLWVMVVLAFTLFLQREGRRLAAVEREIKPIELVKEFPRQPIPEGRFLAGGLLYWSRDNPRVLVRSAQGIAINLGHASTYAWLGYFIGLVLLMTWIAH